MLCCSIGVSLICANKEIYYFIIIIILPSWFILYNSFLSMSMSNKNIVIVIVIVIEYLDSVNCNHRYSMFNFGNFLTKNAITFDQKEIERKKDISSA